MPGISSGGLPPTAIVIGPAKASGALCSLLGPKLLQAASTTDTSSALAGRRFVGVYVSAAWCPPCRAFTPKLVEWYRNHAKSFCMEIVRAAIVPDNFAHSIAVSRVSRMRMHVWIPGSLFQQGCWIDGRYSRTWTHSTHPHDAFLQQVFASADKDEGSFKSYYGSMPWLALPFKQRSIKDKLVKKFGVTVGAVPVPYRRCEASFQDCRAV